MEPLLLVEVGVSGERLQDQGRQEEPEAEPGDLGPLLDVGGVGQVGAGGDPVGRPTYPGGQSPASRRACATSGSSSGSSARAIIAAPASPVWKRSKKTGSETSA